MTTQPSIVLTDAAGFTNYTGRAFIVVDISRETIEKKDLASVLERLHVLNDSAENTRLYESSMILMFDGYNDDLREIPEIPEVREFVQSLVQLWPHFIWFLSRGTGSIALLMALLCEVTVIRSEDGFGTRFERAGELDARFMELVNRGRCLFDHYQIEQSAVDMSIDSAITDLR